MKPISILAPVLATVMTLTTQAGPIYRTDAGTGSAIIVPFWTVDGSQDSLLTINNDGDRPSAVRVRVLNDTGDLLLALGVYLGADDQWTAAFTSNGNQADLLSADASCVLLEDGSGVSGDGVVAVTVATLPAAAGSIEIFEMATAALDTLPSLTGRWPECAALASRFTEGNWSDNPNSGLAAPADGLSANLSILRVGEGTMSTLQGTVLAGFSDVALHAPPVKQEPDFSNATDTGSGNGTVRSRVCFDVGCRIDAWADPLEAVAAVLSTISRA